MSGLGKYLRTYVSLLILGAALTGPAVHASEANQRVAASSAHSCRLENGITHIVHLQFDNVHLRRDNPHVPSDLEQMPNLLDFLEGQGTLLTNHYTPLISHTADDIITTLTGVYGEKHGQPVANGYGYFRPDGSIGFSSSFAYWTDTAPDGKPQMIDQRGLVHPAPWAVFTRKGCDVGAFSTANIEFENIGSDIANVFGANSPQALEAKATPDKAVADFEGIAIHCARHSVLCNKGAAPDLLPDEPGGYLVSMRYTATNTSHRRSTAGRPSSTIWMAIPLPTAMAIQASPALTPRPPRPSAMWRPCSRPACRWSMPT
jgi:hypothetical protein